MGRWAQRTRRGSTPDTAVSPPPPALPAVVGATDDGGGFVTLTFDQAVTANPAGVPDTSMAIDAALVGVVNAAQVGANSIQVEQNVDPSAGFQLTWVGTPPWIVEVIDTTTSTLIT